MTPASRVHLHGLDIMSGQHQCVEIKGRNAGFYQIDYVSAKARDDLAGVLITMPATGITKFCCMQNRIEDGLPCGSVMLNEKSSIGTHNTKMHKANSTYRKLQDHNVLYRCGKCVGVVNESFHNHLKHHRDHHDFKGNQAPLEAERVLDSAQGAEDSQSAISGQQTGSYTPALPSTSNNLLPIGYNQPADHNQQMAGLQQLATYHNQQPAGNTQQSTIHHQPSNRYGQQSADHQQTVSSNLQPGGYNVQRVGYQQTVGSNLQPDGCNLQQVDYQRTVSSNMQSGGYSLQKVGYQQTAALGQQSKVENQQTTGYQGPGGFSHQLGGGHQPPFHNKHPDPHGYEADNDGWPAANDGSQEYQYPL